MIFFENMDNEKNIIDEILKNIKNGEDEARKGTSVLETAENGFAAAETEGFAGSGCDDVSESARKLYKDGEYEKAAELWFKAAEAGDAYAQVCIGVCYLEGEGVAEDVKTALEWFKKSAEQDSPEAHYELGMCYLRLTWYLSSFHLLWCATFEIFFF